MVPQVEDTMVVRPKQLLLIHVVSRPSIKIKRHVKYVRLHNAFDRDGLLNQNWQILLEDEAGDVTILILYDVFNDVVHSSDLVVLQSNINAIGVEETIPAFLFQFVFIDDRVLLVKVLFIF